MAHSVKDQVTETALAVRRFLEPRWAERRVERGEAEPDVPSTDMCRFSSLFLVRVLNEYLPGHQWHVVGGAGEGFDPSEINQDHFPGGLFDGTEHWHSHYWVTDGAFEFTVDITADQFGREPVEVSDDDPADWRENYFPAAVHAHLRDVEERVGKWQRLWRGSAERENLDLLFERTRGVASNEVVP